MHTAGLPDHRVGSGAERAMTVRFRHGRKHDDPRRGAGTSHGLDGGPTHDRHLQVNDDDVWTVLRHEPRRLLPRPALRHHRDAVEILEYPDDRGANVVVVV